ncbi:unnamed protein product (macronuclear) [Paramecium tetraurelia]|uniref:C3H1-type domain-containing protein n=1 Tax=Paramecium tetraurelia TaxID=5888 RepID=A0DWK0_PARTE|nr:uncharacterized protein GSPATT00021060001 [Paramecium tetraurelia]CAK87417.1 unnamed protein product [Paramecium tetraurelia]|eukprot:XP_001454814.1 hypothetical protein (macronuclear) [Paramecium tetraurelia strain d4-2]
MFQEQSFGGQDKSTIECRNLRRHGKCTVSGCPYSHSAASVKPKVLRKVFQGQGGPNSDPNQQQNNYRNNFWNQNNYNNNQNYQGRRDFQFNRLNQINNNQQDRFKQNTYTNQSNNQYQQSQPLQQYDNRQQNQPSYQGLQQQPTIGLQLLYKMNFENLRGFLRIININNNYYFGLIHNKGITFYPYNETKGIDILSKIDFVIQFDVEDAFIQEYTQQNNRKELYCLAVVIIESSLKSVLIYPDFLNSQANFVKVSDISNTYLKYIHVNTLNSELYTFSSDGFIRVFDLQNTQNQLKYYAQQTEVFWSIFFLNETSKGSNFLISTKNGNIFHYINQQFTKLHSLTEQTLVDVTIENDSKRVYLATKSQEMFFIYIINENNAFEGPVYTHRYPIQKVIGFKDFDQINCLLVSDNRGQLDILKEQPSNDQVKFLRQIQYKQIMGDVKKIMFFKMSNVNQVVEKMIFVQRSKDPQRQESTNFEFYRFYQIF